MFQYSIILEIIVCEVYLCNYSFFISFLLLYIINMFFFFKFVVLLMCKNNKKCIFDVIFHLISSIFSTAETIHCSNWCCLCHCEQMFTSCSFWRAELQLLPTFLHHRVVPSVVNPANRVLSLVVHHLHKVLRKIERELFCVDREIVNPAHRVLPPQFITCIRC